MIRRLLSACLGAAAFVGVLDIPARTIAKPPDPPMYQLRPTARRTLAGSMLFGINPLLALMPTDKALDTPNDHPQYVNGEDVLAEAPDGVIDGLPMVSGPPSDIDSSDALAAEALPMPREDAPHKKKHKKHHRKGERLSMPQEDAPATPSAAGVTCPYLRQQYVDRHACQLADPQIGHDVLDNLDRLKKAEALLELAEEFAQGGYVGEALECCLHAQELCPGSPCASRAADVMLNVCFGTDKPARGAEETAEEPNADASAAAAGVEEQVRGLMKACRLLMNEGRHEQAAELARQAFALDPERVMADPLLYKMHLLADTPEQQPAGSSEASEPPSCPYCPPVGKPIPGIVPEKKPTEADPTTLLVPPLPPIDYEVVPALERVLKETTTGAEETSEVESDHFVFGVGVGADGNLRMNGEYASGDSVYHVLYKRGRLAIWATPNAANTKP